MRVIWVPVADRPESIQVLHTSFLLAKQLQASLIGCHIRPHDSDKVSLYQSLEIGSEAAWKVEYTKKNRKSAPRSARAVFTDIAAQYGYPLRSRTTASAVAYWHEKKGSPSRVLAQNAPLSDLVVVSKPKNRSSRVARMFLSAALANESTATLVLPQKASPQKLGASVCIAWNGSEEASRAVHTALPIIREAQQVRILSVGDESDHGPRADRLRNYFLHWGIDAELVHKRNARDDGEALIAMFKKCGGDLLVMGAYSRPRAAERIFGGVTNTVLNHRADIPLLLHG